MAKIKLFLIPLLILLGGALFAHNGKKHDKPAQDTVQTDTAHAEQEHGGAHHAAADTGASHAHSLDAFPTLHPMVVHFPIVLLILAALLQWVGLFVFKREISIVAWAVLLLGFVGAYASSNWFHAHTAELTPEIRAILLEHEKYASYTQWLSGLTVLVQFVNLFFLGRNRSLNVMAAIVMTMAALAVAYTGHHGAELIHKHGIGAKGYLLEQHHH